MREAVDERDGAGRIREDGVPLFEGRIRRDHDRLLFVAAADDLEEQVGGVGVIGEIANLVDGEELRPQVASKAVLSARGLFPGG